MDIRKNGKMKVLSLILSLVLMMGFVPTTVFAVPAEELWVNGVNILIAANNTVACGSGTATYNPTAATLTLNNAVIKTAYNGMGISKQGANDATNKLIIELIGVNKIAANEMNQIHMGIYSMGTVSIRGAGSLLIETAVDSDSHVPAGIYAWGGCNITDSRITVKNTSSYQESFSSAIDVNKFDASLQIINAIISIDNYIVGINVPSGDVTVQGSRITVTNADCGISGGNEIDNFIIQGSVLDFTGEGVASVGLLNGRDIQIDSSLVKIISQNSNAVYTDGAITIRSGSSLEMKAFYPALFSTLDTTITDSTVTAISTDDSGIYSRANIFINGTSDILARGHWAGINANGNITINNGKIYSTSSNDMGIYLRGIFTMNGGDVYAQGATDFAAIGARYTKQEGDTEPVEKIVINSNYADISGGKVSVSDWYNGASGETTWSRSWSSFIAGNDNKLASDRSNALNEIAIKIKLADYSAVDTAIAKIPANLTIYTDATANAVTAAKNAVVRGKDITEQAIVDGYVTAIEDAVTALVKKGADYTAVDTAIAKIPAVLTIYTDATANAVTAAKNAVVRGKDITEQAIVDGYVTAIEDAVTALVKKGADYTAVDTAIAKIPADLTIYIDATANAVTAAKNAVVRDKDITEQAIVDGYVTAIEDAVNALVKKGADYTAVDTAIAKIPADLTIYTDATANAVTAAKNAVVRGKDITGQAIVDGYVTAIEDAVNALVKKGADYTAVDTAIAKVPADLTIYTDATANAVIASKNAVVRGKDITEQSVVDGYVTAIENAVAALKLKPVDPTMPEIISGANQKVEQGKSATFTSNSDFANFLNVLIDGNEISSDKYTVKEGSTIVILNEEFIKTLSEGNHTISIVSTDGRADAGFTVTKASKPTIPNTDIPQTGDNSHMALWMSLLFISAGGVLTLLLKRKRGSV